MHSPPLRHCSRRWQAELSAVSFFAGDVSDFIYPFPVSQRRGPYIRMLISSPISPVLRHIPRRCLPIPFITLCRHRRLLAEQHRKRLFAPIRFPAILEMRPPPAFAHGPVCSGFRRSIPAHARAPLCRISDATFRGARVARLCAPSSAHVSDDD